jgi:hypothetical protein
VALLLLCVAGLVYAAVRLARGPKAQAWRTADAAACAEAVPLGPICGACVAASCCKEISACYTRADCIDLNDCWVRCGDEDESPKVGRAACPGACEKRYPGAISAFHAWDDCVRDRCGDVCPRGADDEKKARR